MIAPNVSRPDLDAIEELHRRDVAATKSGDIDGLRALMDAECMVYPPSGEAVTGQDYLDQVGSVADAETELEILELEQSWQDLNVVGDLAYEQGLVRYAVRDADGKAIRESQRLMRILRRQDNGEWRVYRAMWHEPIRVKD